MRSFYKYTLTGLLLCLFSLAGTAQTLAELLAASDSANLELQALYHEYLAARERGPQVSQLPEPEFGLGLFVLPVETRLGPQWVRLSASQMFPWKGTLQAREDVDFAMASVRYERIAATRLLLHDQIRTAYIRLQEMDWKQVILRDNIALTQELERIVTTRVETGRASLADLLRIQVKTRGLEEELKLVENLKHIPQATINQVLNRRVDLSIVPMDTLVVANLNHDRDPVFAAIRDEHPSLRMLALQQEVSQKTIQLNALEGKPSFNAGIDYIAVGRRSDATPAGNGRDILSPRIGIRIPIYRDKYRAKAQEEKWTIQALEYRKEDQFLQFQREVEQAYAEYEDGRIRHALAREQKAIIQSAIELQLTAYSTNGAGFLDLIQMEDQLLQYDLQMLSAMVKTQMAQAQLQKIIPQSERPDHEE
ncbi:MAG: TolC family protein [Lewinellaceae bacterium]|nr:TolC family protein [Saprospiraceae bacterium]MCB9312198.1 TolC family protein [Lewinellaceae bacterium]